MSYCTYWLGQRHRLPALWLAAWTPLCLLPLAACRRVGGELAPSSPCGRACKCKDSFSAYYLSDSGLWRLPPSVCVCVCVCWLETRDKERESGRERQAAFLLPPLASPSPCSLSLHPSSPLLDHPPALLWAWPRPPSPPLPPRPPRDPLTLLTSPPHHRNIWAGKSQLISVCAEAFKKYFLPSSLSSYVLLFFAFLPLTCSLWPRRLCLCIF